MSTRRTHRKSRHGCLQCKRRRVKCDEQRPQCANCLKRHTECEYSAATPILWKNGELSRSPDSCHDSQAEQPLVTNTTFDFFGRFTDGGTSALPASDLNMLDLELMMHWCTSTYHGMARDEHSGYLWREVVPREALSHSFLMRGILALSALDLASVNSGSKRAAYISTAVAQQNQALALFRELLGDINPSNCKAMFSFSSLVVGCALAFPVEPGSPEPLALVDDLYRIIVLARGMQGILSRAHFWLQNDEDFGPFLKGIDEDPDLSEDTKMALRILHDANEICAEKDADHDAAVYKEVINRTGIGLETTRTSSNGMTVIGWWAIKLLPKYVDDLRDHKPLALIILGYYCLILHRARYQRLIQNWGSTVMKAIYESLDIEDRSCLSLAMEEVLGDQATDMAFNAEVRGAANVPE